MIGIHRVLGARSFCVAGLQGYITDAPSLEGCTSSDRRSTVSHRREDDGYADGVLRARLGRRRGPCQPSSYSGNGTNGLSRLATQARGATDRGMPRSRLRRLCARTPTWLPEDDRVLRRGQRQPRTLLAFRRGFSTRQPSFGFDPREAGPGGTRRDLRPAILGAGWCDLARRVLSAFSLTQLGQAGEVRREHAGREESGPVVV